MKIIVIGLGSMGKRRIRLLRQIDAEIELIGVDAREERRQETKDKYNIAIAADIDSALSIAGESVAGVVISTSPLSHAAIIGDCLSRGLNVFTELNLVSDGYDENIKLAEDNDLVLFLSSTFLYRDEIKYIQKKVQESSSKLSYSYHIGQYLPDWHPWENYKAFFVGDKRTNGCREIMAIEFPWLIKTFGDISGFKVISEKKSSLEIGYPDSYQMLIRHNSGTVGTLSVDVVSRKPVRNLEIYGEDIYLSWDGSAEGLALYNITEKKNECVSLYDEIDHQEGYSAFVVENAYKNELIAFLNQVQHGQKPIYTFSDDKRTLDIIDMIESQAEDRD